uniref:Homeobox domain-containing protein n=1 Tax=Globodera rostochiensis TaxID=31243 RepID=A0A914H8J2_GLORO
MEKLWILILVSFVETNSLDKGESVQLFDEIFGEGWWDNDKAEEWHKLTLEHNFHNQIDRQNAQLGQIEPNSTDQNPSLTESDHSDNAKNGEEQNENIAEDERKPELTRDGFKNSYKEINEKVAKELGLSFVTIYNWKRKLGQTKPTHKYSHSEQMELMKRYYEIKDKNPENRDEDIAKMLKIGSRTLINWKRQFKRQEFHQNSVDGHAGSNVQEIVNSGRHRMPPRQPPVPEFTVQPAHLGAFVTTQ